MPWIRAPRAPLTELTRAARLRRWVTVIGVAAVVLNAAVATYDQWRSYRQTMDETRRELANVARLLSAQTVGNLRTIDVLLRDTADWYAREGAATTPGAIDAALARRVEGLPHLLRLTIADAQGVVRYRSGSSRGLPRTEVLDRPYFTAPRDNPALGLFLSERFTTRSDQRSVIALSRRLTNSRGEFAGVVTGLIDLAWLQQFFHAINLGPRGAIALLHDNDKGATVVVREPPIEDVSDQQLEWQLPAQSEDSEVAAVTVAAGLDRVNRVVAAKHMDGFPLAVAAARDQGAVLLAWRDDALRVAARTLVLSLLAALAIAALVRQLRRVEFGEQALRESEQRYALAMEGANEGHFDWNLQGGPSFLSTKMKTMHGLAPDAKVVNRKQALAGVDIHPDDRPRADAAFENHVRGRTERYEIEYRVRRGAGEWGWLQVRGRCLRDQTGNPYRFVGSVIDVTEHRRADAERERLEGALTKSQKMEAMGTLAGGIAHDFNNILGAILGYGEMAQKNSEEGSVVRRYIDNVMSAGERAKSLVERILAFSRSGFGQRVPVHVQAVAEETLALLAASLPPGVHLSTKLDAGNAAVIGDATQLHEVLMNLCTNAYQAMPGGGAMDVLVERVEVVERRVLSHGELAPQPYVRITVLDSGTGIEPQVIERMFDPFFTTKGVGEGTGLGLSLVHGIVADVGGAIDVVSAPGKGTTFTVWLPVAGSAEAPTRATAGELPIGSGQVVMVVDDEPALVALTEEMLAVLGYEPAGFESSTAALAAFRAEPKRFDFVLTDETMPQMSGTTLASEIHRLRPEIPIVLMTGYSDSGVATRAAAAGVLEVLHKPLTSRDTAECLARALYETQS